MAITINLRKGERQGQKKVIAIVRLIVDTGQKGSSVSRRFLASTEDGLVSIIRSEKIDYKS